MRAETAVIEYVTFTLIHDTDEAAFLTAARATEALVRRQAGFVARNLSRGSDGRWTDAVTWASMKDALNAPQAVMSDPDFHPFMAMIDGPSAQMRHETLALTMA